MENIISNIIKTTDSHGGAFINYDNFAINVNFGNMNKQHINSTNTLYRIFSLSKAITAVAILLLVQEDKLKLNSNIGFGKIKKMTGYKNVKIIDLLNHKSGLLDAVSYVFFEKKSDIYSKIVPTGSMKTKSMNIDQIIYVINKYGKPLEKNYKYNNTNYDLLGYIIKYITRGKVETFISNKIFKPLNMNATFMNSPSAKMMSMPYQSRHAYGVLEHQGDINCNANIISTLDGYGKFLRGYNTLLDATMVRKFQSLYFFNKYNGKLLFYATGSGDFQTTGIYRQLSKSCAVFDPKSKNMFIASQNYMGKKNPLIFQQLSFKRGISDYKKLEKANVMKMAYDETIFAKIIKRIFKIKLNI